MSDEQFGHQREFERHPIDFHIEVSPVEGDYFCDRTVLKNISGGGVCFSTDVPDCYSAGMKVLIKVFLPEVDGAEVSLDCKGKIVWMHRLAAGDAAESVSPAMLVGLCLDGFMSFENYHPADESEEGRS